jgi:mediator of RNA polymerase II transcription subunit 25
MAEKQLIVAVEGTAAMGPFWQTVVSDYLEKIIRSNCLAPIYLYFFACF